MNYNSVLQDIQLKDLLNKKPDPWVGTPYEGYVYINNKIKGKYGELFIEKLMVSHSHTVKPKNDAGHDRIIDGIPTEIKFSLAMQDSKNPTQTIKDQFIFNHIAKNKPWDRCILVGVNYNCDPIIKWFTKKDFLSLVDSGPLFDQCNFFQRQQSGNKGSNDDWMLTSNKWNTFLQQPWVKDITEW